MSFRFEFTYCEAFAAHGRKSESFQLPLSRSREIPRLESRLLILRDDLLQFLPIQAPRHSTLLVGLHSYINY